MTVRTFKPADLATLHKIDAACFPPGVSYSLAELRAFIRHRHSKTWVAEENGEIIGFLVAQRLGGDALHIVTIDVKEGWRRRGVGTALMDIAEEWGRRQSLSLVSLETAEDNQRAQAFYKKRGYIRLNRIERYYANGAAAWVMGKWLR
jgi:ribosomal protein S18 acetylase RimI-like enzyme